MDPDTAMSDLRAATDRYREADGARRRALQNLQDHIRKADAADIPRAQIIAITGLARQTVYDALKQDSQSS